MAAPGFAGAAGVEGSQPSAAEITQPLLKSYQELGRALAGPTSASQLSGKEIADRLEKLFPLLEAAEREIPRDTFDIQAVIGKVGRDPIKLFEWVRDNTYLVPYRGVLRGGTGVLMDRLGNSLDRALLLCGLLRSTGQTVRLAHGTLTESQASQVSSWARSLHALPTVPTTPNPVDEFIQNYAGQKQLDRLRLRNAVDQLTAEQLRVGQLIQKRVEMQTSMLAAAVGSPPPGERARDEASQIRVLRDHWWVQRQSGSAWVDLDPTLSHAVAGQALTNALETAAPDKLPGPLHHDVSIRVLIERWEEGRLREVPVLAHDLRPSELLGKDIVLRHVPLKWPRDLNLYQEKNPLERFKSAVLAQDEWLPTLTVADAVNSQSSFLDSGETNAAPLGPLLGSAAQGLGRRTGNILAGGRIGQAEGRKQEKTTYVTAEWIEFQIHAPGHPVRTIRREIFDSIGFGARSKGSIPRPDMTDAKRLERGLRLIGETQILAVVSQLSPEFLQQLAADRMLANRNALRGILLTANSQDFKALADQARRITPPPTCLYSMAVARGDWNRSRGDVFLDQPNIFAYHKQLRPRGTDALVVYEALDFVVNEVAVRPGSTSEPFTLRMAQGVLDTGAEALLATSNCAINGAAGCAAVANTSELALASTVAGPKWVTVKSTADPAWQHVDLPKDVLARAKQDLDAGYTVVVPAKPIIMQGRSEVGWWRVNPGTGDTLGMDEGGGGQAATEVELMLADILTYVAISLVFAICVARAPQPIKVVGGGFLSAANFPYLCGIGACVFAAAVPGLGLALGIGIAGTAILGAVGGIGSALLPPCSY